MGMSKQAVIRKLQGSEQFFVAYAQATKLPYVTCDEETYNDQAWIFASEEQIREFGKKLLEDKILLMGMRYEKKDFARLYGNLYAIGVNSVIWVEGEEQVEVELSDIARQPDMTNVEPQKRPLLNPSLQLSAIYFLQELRRPVEKGQHRNLREMEEELLANLKKSEFLLAMEVNAEDPKKVNIPYLKDKKEQILQPVFSDVIEFQKFAKGKKFRIAKLPFAKLSEMMIPQAAACVINPMGFNLPLNKEQMKKIIG